MLAGAYPRRLNMHAFDIRKIDGSGEILEHRGVLFPGQAEGLNPQGEDDCVGVEGWWVHDKNDRKMACGRPA